MNKRGWTYVVLWLFSLTWTAAMIKLWKWNVEGTGWWFALLMLLGGIVLHVATWAHYFDGFKFIGNFLRKYVFYRKSK